MTRQEGNPTMKPFTLGALAGVALFALAGLAWLRGCPLADIESPLVHL
ncbi:hypothetical protein [Mycolicibacterium palauense]|nr:hypothetical protein [Mycolicibacterium palauense]